MPRTRRDIEDRAFRLASDVIRFCERQNVTSTYATQRLYVQLRDAVTSVGANLEEAAAAQSKPDFVSKTSIALKEARETLYWLRLLAESDDTLRSAIEPMRRESNEIVAILTSIVRKARSNPHRG